MVLANVFGCSSKRCSYSVNRTRSASCICFWFHSTTVSMWLFRGWEMYLLERLFLLPGGGACRGIAPLSPPAGGEFLPFAAGFFSRVTFWDVGWPGQWELSAVADRGRPTSVVQRLLVSAVRSSPPSAWVGPCQKKTRWSRRFHCLLRDSVVPNRESRLATVPTGLWKTGEHSRAVAPDFGWSDCKRSSSSTEGFPP